MKTSPVILFFKSHIDTFTRKDGSVVQAHDDKRVKQHHEMTPKQYHESKLQGMSAEHGVPMSEVREMYDDDAGKSASKDEWVGHVKHAFKTGKDLSRQTLDHLENERPGSVGSFSHDHPEAKIPNGYQTPSARASEKTTSDAKKADRASIKVDHAKPKGADWRDEENWHSRTMAKMKTHTEAELRYIHKDATEAAEAGEKMGSKKSGQYRDEAHYASMELKSRRDAVPKR